MRILECCTCFFFRKRGRQNNRRIFSLKDQEYYLWESYTSAWIRHQSDTTVIQKTNAKQFGRDDSWRWGKESEGTAMHV